MEGTATKKSFWQRPEGKTGIVIMILLGVGALMGLNEILPWLINLTKNTITFMALLAVVGLVLFLVTNRQIRTLVFFAFKQAMRFLTGIVIQIDPIAILKTYLRTLSDNLNDMNEQISKVRGEVRKLKNKISDNESKAKQHLKLAKAARDKNLQRELMLNANNAKRLQESNVKLQTLEVKLDSIYRVLVKMHGNLSFVYEDTKNDIELKESEWNAIKRASSAVKSAMSFINGNPDQRAVYEQTLEFMADDLGNKIGEMEHFMEMSEDIMNGIDLQNDVFDEEGLQLLEQWEKDADSFILGKDKATLIEENKPKMLDIEKNSAKKYSEIKDSYSGLFN